MRTRGTCVPVYIERGQGSTSVGLVLIILATAQLHDRQACVFYRTYVILGKLP